MSTVKCQISVSCDFDVLVVLVVTFFTFSIFKSFILQQTIKDLSVMNLHNLCFFILYHNMLQNGKNQTYLNSTGLLIYKPTFFYRHFVQYFTQHYVIIKI
jgi:hypothetical protein